MRAVRASLTRPLLTRPCTSIASVASWLWSRSLWQASVNLDYTTLITIIECVPVRDRQHRDWRALPLRVRYYAAASRKGATRFDDPALAAAAAAPSGSNVGVDSYPITCALACAPREKLSPFERQELVLHGRMYTASIALGRSELTTSAASTSSLY